MFHNLLIVFLSGLTICQGAIQLADFFPYGTDAGDDITPPGHDQSTLAIQLMIPFPFFSYLHDRLWVNNNGAISFVNAISAWNPQCRPLTQDFRMVTTFWADIDPGRALGGTVYYRETTERALLQKAAQDVMQAFPEFWDIQLGWAFIVTWDRVTYNGASECYGNNQSAPVPRNTFQVAITTDGVHSFAILYYNSVTWTTGVASGGNACTGLGGNAAKVGFDAGDGVNYYMVPASCTSEIANIDDTSNVGVPGMFIDLLDTYF